MTWRLKKRRTKEELGSVVLCALLLVRLPLLLAIQLYLPNATRSRHRGYNMLENTKRKKQHQDNKKLKRRPNHSKKNKSGDLRHANGQGMNVKRTAESKKGEETTRHLAVWCSLS